MNRLLLFILIAVTYTANAQKQITGYILNTDNEPIPYANILSFNTTDSTFIEGTVSDNNGYFCLNNSQTSICFLKISFIGFKDKLVSPEENKWGDCLIILQPDIQELAEISITAKRPTYKMEDNKLIMNVSNTILSGIGNAKEVIKKLPGIISKEDNIEVLGKGSPIIYINHKRIINDSELTSLKSEDIENIQLISNPGARYNAAGRSVLIIKTRKKNKNNFSTYLAETARVGKRFSNANNLNLNYTTNHINTYFNFSSFNQKKKSGELINQTIYSDTIWYNLKKAKYIQNFNTYTINPGIDIEINPDHNMGVQYIYNYFPNRILANTKDSLFHNSLFCLDNHSENRIRSGINQHSINIFHNITYNKFLSSQANFDYINHISQSSSKILEDGDDIKRKIRTKNKSVFNIYAFNLNLDYKINQNHTLSLGSESASTRGNGWIENEENIIDDSKSGNKELRISPYAEYSFSKKIRLLFGIRYEYIDSKSEDKIDLSQSIYKKYSNLFPNISIYYPFNEQLETSISYTTRINRPSFNQLNNNLFYSSRFHYEKGNPKLMPETSYNLDYLIRYKQHIVKLEYRYSKDYISTYSYIDETNSSRTIGTIVNYPKYQQLTVSAGSTINIGLWENTLYYFLLKPWAKAFYLGKDHKYNSPMHFITSYNTFTLPKDIIIHIDFNYNTSGNSELTNWYQQKTIDIGIRKSFLNKACDVKLWFKDILNTSAYSYKTNYGYVSFFKNANEDNRYIQLQITYQLNTPTNKYKGKSAAQEEKQRL